MNVELTAASQVTGWVGPRLKIKVQYGTDAPNLDLRCWVLMEYVHCDGQARIRHKLRQ